MEQKGQQKRKPAGRNLCGEVDTCHHPYLRSYLQMRTAGIGNISFPKWSLPVYIKHMKGGSMPSCRWQTQNESSGNFGGVLSQKALLGNLFSYRFWLSFCRGFLYVYECMCVRVCMCFFVPFVWIFIFLFVFCSYYYCCYLNACLHFNYTKQGYRFG